MLIRIRALNLQLADASTAGNLGSPTGPIDKPWPRRSAALDPARQPPPTGQPRS